MVKFLSTSHISSMNDSDAKEAWSDIVTEFLHKISDNSL